MSADSHRGTVGCVMGVLIFGMLTLCLCPLAGGIGGFTSTLAADSVAGIMGPLLCPANSTGEIVTHQATTTNRTGTQVPATGYEMQCVDQRGMVVRAPSPDYGFYWIGILMLGSVALSALLALAFAVPLSKFVAGLLQRARTPSH